MMEIPEKTEPAGEMLQTVRFDASDRTVPRYIANELLPQFQINQLTTKRLCFLIKNRPSL